MASIFKAVLYLSVLLFRTWETLGAFLVLNSVRKVILCLSASLLRLQNYPNEKKFALYD